ncbi:MAG: siderophore-interacting protein [Ruminococcaceae bacterium]|nr:siderophore-interacting protein [Oscillospiraceae bacterium]
MTEAGIVIKTEEKRALVQVIRKSACGEHCVHCGACAKNTVEIWAKNPVGAKKGESVLLELSDQKIYRAAFLVYLLPLIFFFVGYFLSGMWFANEITKVFIGGVLFVLSIVGAAVYSRKCRQEYVPAITKIVL